MEYKTFKENDFSLTDYQKRAVKFGVENKKVTLALPTGSGKTLTSQKIITDLFPENFRLIFVTEKVAIDDIIESMEKFFHEGIYRAWSSSGLNPDGRQDYYAGFLSGEYNSMVTTYATMRNDNQYLITLARHFKSNNIPFVMVLDEASNIKNQSSQNHIIASELGRLSDLMINLTATPISSKLSDIDNIIRSTHPEDYLSQEDFKRSFEINQIETNGFLFKMKNSNFRIDSDNDALPKRVLKSGVQYFKIPWKLEPATVITSIVVHNKRRKVYKTPKTVVLDSMRMDKEEYSADNTPYLSLDKLESTGFAYFYVPIVRSYAESSVKFRSVGLSINIKRPGSAEKELLTNFMYSYSIDGTTIGFKNLNKYREKTEHLLFTMKKSEVGQIPPTTLKVRKYHTDSLTKKAVTLVYENAKGPANIGRLVSASTAVSEVLDLKTLHVNNKAKLLIEDLKSELSEKPILIFSPYVRVLNYLSLVLDKHNIDHCSYHGQLPDKEKQENKNAFKVGKKRVMLISSAAAKGVNLQMAGVMIMYDLPFTAENYMQVSGRISRVGSKFKNLILHVYQAESEYAVENCLHMSVQGQMNFINAVDTNLVDKDLLDENITLKLDPEEADKYMLSRLGHSRRYYETF